MKKRLFASTGAVAFVMALGSMRIAGLTSPGFVGVGEAFGGADQAAQIPTKSTSAVKADKAWTPPRLPWGDPDISGNFTNVYEEATPLERPDELAGVARSDVKGAELATLLAKRRDQSLENFDAGSDVHAPTFWWADSLKVEKGGQAWFITDPPDGKAPPFTPEAQKRIAARVEARRSAGRGPADSYADRSLYDRCITRGLPGSMMPAIYGNSYRIVQGQGYVGIQYEMIHETRVIPLDGRAHVSKSIHLDMGDARGHWEGDALVVETTNFNERSAYRNANPDTLRLIERFQRTAPDKVQWTVTVDDPRTWTRPWTYSMPLTMDDKEQIYEYACHEGNLGLANILSGTRADEKAVEEAATKGIRLTPRAVPTGGEER
jgi:hypothetical protein